MYDLIIIGAGPAGLTSSIYASCFHLKHIVLSKTIGGQLLFAPDILNYPGFESISGEELTNRMVSQVKKRGGEIVEQAVEKISKIENTTTNGKSTIAYEVTTEKSEAFQGKAVILATGTERRKLNVPGEVQYTAKGVHYCATCEKFDYENKVSAVIGGANSAVQAAVELAQAASKVYILYRGSELRGDPIWVSQVTKNPIIEILYHTQVKEIVGDGKNVTGVKISTGKPTEQQEKVLPLDKVFIEIGGVPGTALVIPIGVSMDPGGYIKVDEHLVTSAPGVFAAGDLVSYGLSIEQISSAVGLGARASASAFAYIKEEKKAPTLWGGSQIKR
ncbi:FAD-dependent oxidoreductase [Candidatus Gottesmanbacteria bacterium]|nr:FAD-dependent oxidoreductase [Candidatus Gottesmanbacteria bacterium]